MKINLNPRRNSGLSVLGALILIILLLVFIGTLLWTLWKAIQNLSRPSEALHISQVVSNEVAALQAQFPGETITVAAVSASYAFDPIMPTLGNSNINGVVVTVERSTNLTHWEAIAVLQPGETFVDTNPPPIQGFYRSYYTVQTNQP